MTQTKDLTHLLSEEAKSRKPSKLKLAFVHYGKPDIVFLGGGLPLSEYFPFEKIVATVPKAPFEQGIGAKISSNDGFDEVEVVKVKSERENHVELARSLQYGYTEGHTELVAFLKKHTEIVHKVPYSSWGLVTTTGNTQGWDAVLRTFLNRGETILVDEYSFSSSLEACNGLGIKAFPVPMDTSGLIPEELERILDQWEGPKPKLLYLIPTGQNPTGSSLSLERRKKVYELACKHDFLIVEDEPYYFLQMEPYTEDKEARESAKVSDHSEFLKALIPSFISLDVEGRVLRLDSFSKVMAPGVRLGWIIAQDVFIERFIRLHEVSIQNPSGFTQSILNGLLYNWGQDGYIEWLLKIRQEYTHKRDVTIDAIKQYCPPDLTVYVPPVAGMFFTVYFDASKHPKFHQLDNDPLKIEKLIYDQSFKQGCLLIPGSWFKVDHPTNPQSNLIFFRGTYAAVPLDQLVKGIERLGDAVKIEFGV